MSRTAPLFLAALVVAAVAIVIGTSSSLPETVATRFGGGGRANGYMTRAGYQLFYCGFIVVMTLVVYITTAWLPARHPALVNVPNRAYWLAPPRREAALAAIRVFGVALAVAMLTLLVAIHLLILEAHQRTPAMLAEGAFFGLLGGFVAVLAVLIILLLVRFRAPG